VGVQEEDAIPANADVTAGKYGRGVQLRYNYRLDPASRHRIAIGKAFGCARVVFNDALAVRDGAHQAGLPFVTDAELSARLTAAKRTPERAWLNEVSAVVLQQALADLNAAYRNFFASRPGKRKGPKMAPPRFRSRKNRRQAIRFTANARFKVLPNGKLRLPKIGDVPVRWSRPLPSQPSSVTVIKDAAGRYFASFVVETGPDALPQAEPVVGWAAPPRPQMPTGPHSPSARHRAVCAFLARRLAEAVVTRDARRRRVDGARPAAPGGARCADVRRRARPDAAAPHGWEYG